MNKEDLQALQMGRVPVTDDLVEQLTMSGLWLEKMKEYCLKGVIQNGGCKVKILHGDHATGKSHYCNYLRIIAEREGFFVVMFDLEKIEFKLTDIVSFYKNIASAIDINLIKSAILNRMLNHLGYNQEAFDKHQGSLIDVICEMESAPLYSAKQLVRKCINEISKPMDIGFSFRLFLMRLMEALSESDHDLADLLFKWLKGEKLNAIEKRQCQIFENLNKSNARILLYSLTEFLKLAGYKGLVMMFDHFECILPEYQTQIKYTAAKRNDIYEMLRQLIDDLDFLNNFLLIISGLSDIVENETHGLQSYQALWMRIQQSYKQDFLVNPYADMTDAGLIMKQLVSEGKMKDLANRIDELMSACDFHILEKEDRVMNDLYDFRSVIVKHTQKYCPED
ncbi:MAG: DUF2791 family P-loop domain-containing protein [Candidatus Cloacimonetes bacterium]|nr:DUF2791 family P-loop domain-containing protein [Candidatus Cloacimonadota bacterium]